jgi:3'(2'), 5'-bisphosphate nucleotidase
MRLMSDLKSEMATAMKAVHAASHICAAVQQNLVTADSMSKKDRSPVTVADFASQAVVCSMLQQAFPDDPVVGEENAKALRSDEQAVLRQSVVHHASSVLAQTLERPPTEDQVLDLIDHGNGEASTNRYWTVDPIDGTKGFLRGQQYCIALALIENGQVTLGVMGCPNLPVQFGSPNATGILMSAARGQGTGVHVISDMPSEYANETESAPSPNAMSVKVSDVAQALNARFCGSVESAHSDQGAATQIASLLGITADPIQMDSQCKYAAIARGDASIYLRLPTTPGRREWIWDHAAGVICVQEAGGTVTDILGKSLDFSKGKRLEDNRGVVASNGRFHQQIIDAVSQVSTLTD